MKRLNMVIYGEVQGVGFRHFVQKQAISLGLKGYVQNVTGAVEIVAEGYDDKLQELVRACKKGPIFSQVVDEEHSIVETKGEFKDFGIRH
ncbi:acylphosphatase [Candidatus Woesearchaeota archaeon]|nr:acylphosphatase [Candidatus Woesearchaeota archaeon]